MNKKIIEWAAQAILYLCILFSTVACEKSLNLKLTEEQLIDSATFDAAKGLELPYQLYMPNSMAGWAIDASSRFHFDAEHKIYFIEGISIKALQQDTQGYRFKLCSDGWLYQFGFGTYITDDESTIGLSMIDTVVRVERFSQASTDIRLELPLNLDSKNDPKLRVEFKLIRWEPKPEALLRLHIY